MSEPTASESTPNSLSTAGTGSKRARRSKMGRGVRRVLLVLLTLAVLALLIIAWLPKPVEVDVAQVTTAHLRVTVDEDGQARVKDRYVISAPLTGSLARIELDPGDTLQQGQVIARIVPVLPPLLDERTRTSAQAQVAAAQAAKRQAQAQIERAKANLQFAQGEATRQAELLKQGTTSRVQTEQAELARRTASAELDSAHFTERVANFEIEMAQAALRRLSAHGAQARGEQLDLPAPVAGRVLKVFHESEGVVQAAIPLLEVGDPSALEIAIDVLTSDAVRIAAGAIVVLDRWGGPQLEGRVRRVEPSAFTRVSSLGVEEQRVNVLVDLISPSDSWKALGDGYRVEAHIVVWEEENVVQVPASATFRHGQGWAVYALEKGKARLCEVEIGQRTGAAVQILNGLNPGGTVIVHPSDRVADGVTVEPR